MNFDELVNTLKVTDPDQAKRLTEYKVYYTEDGKVITYTTETLQGQYILITKDQYDQARPDALVKNGKLVYTHINSHIIRLNRNPSEGIPTSKYDINIIEDSPNSVYWANEFFEIR